MHADDDRAAVAALDTAFQRAVKTNDVRTLQQILHQDMILVLGDGRVSTRSEQLKEASGKSITYEHQEEDPGTQVVRVWGDTAVVTALLWIKGTSQGRRFDRRLWFSDTYIRTESGWKYVFGQASLPLGTVQPRQDLGSAVPDRG